MQLRRIFWITSLFLFVAPCDGQTEAGSEVKQHVLGLEAEYSDMRKKLADVPFQEKVDELNTKYSKALARLLQQATAAGKLEEAIAMKEEIACIEEKGTVPEETADETPRPLQTLRTTYRSTLQTFRKERADATTRISTELDRKLLDYQTLLTRESQLEDALYVKGAREKIQASVATVVNAGEMTDQGSNLLPDGAIGITTMNSKIADDIPENVSVIIDLSWIEDGDVVIREAARRSAQVVLAFGEDTIEQARSEGLRLAKEYPDVVVGLAWQNPFFDEISDESISQFRELITRASPDLKLWGFFVEKPRGKFQKRVVPDAFDVLVVRAYYARSSEDLRKKNQDCMAGWVKKAGGRPLVLEWVSWSAKEPSVVSSVDPETMDACVEAYRRYDLSGLLLGQLGRSEGVKGVESNRDLLEKIGSLRLE